MEIIDSDFVNNFNEFVFPISGKIILLNVSNITSKNLPREFGIQFNTAIIERSKRFVACQNKDFLEALIRYYKLHIQFEKTDTIIPYMFEIIKSSIV